MLDMHSFHDQETGITIHYNGDYSGEAKIVIPADIVDGLPLSELVKLDDQGNLWITDLIAVGALQRFAHTATIGRAITALENLEP
jgi:hypothetical protein